MKTNYHMHTYRCHHATNEPDEAYVLSAIEAGFEEIAFSDHVPFVSVPYHEDYEDRMRYEELQDYLASLSSLQKKYQNQITIKSGFEIEYYPEYQPYYESLRSQVDLFLLGQHYQLPISKDYAIFARDEDLAVYVSQVEAAAKSGLFDLIAHPDYFMLGRSGWSDGCAMTAHRIAQIAVQYDIPLEINLNGMRYGKKEYDGKPAYAYPFRLFWEIVAQYPVRVFYGYDAHASITLKEDWRITEVNQVLQGLTFHIIDHIDWRTRL